MQDKFEKSKSDIYFFFYLGEVVILRRGTLTFLSKIFHSCLQFLTIETEDSHEGFATVRETVKPSRRRSGAHVRVRGSGPRVSKQGRMVGSHVVIGGATIVSACESWLITVSGPVAELTSLKFTTVKRS